MSRDTKAILYHLCRRGWHEQLITHCDNLLTKKKDPFALFWRAYAIGRAGNVSAAIGLFEEFQGKRDMQFPSTLALAYFHKCMPNVDIEFVDQLQSELSISEDVTKEGGLILGARLALFTDDYETAERLAEKVLQPCKASNAPPSTPLELEAISIQHWSLVISCIASGSGDRRLLQPIHSFISAQHNENVDIDDWMALAKSKTLLKQYPEALNIYNQVIAMYSWFIPALSEKALLLASMGEWEQSLDTTQRVLDVNADNLDALRILAVHAFTQEALPEDAMQKLEDFDVALNTLESSSSALFCNAGSLFARICSRLPRALQLCERQLDRASRLDPKSSKILCELAYVLNLQGQHKTAMRHLRDASKRDGGSILAVEGLMYTHVLDGELSDAEAQLDLLQVMKNSPEEETVLQLFLEAVMARKGASHNMGLHLDRLMACRKMFMDLNSESKLNLANEPLQEYVTLDPDFTLLLATEFLVHLESPPPLLFSPGSKESSSRSKFLGDAAMGSDTKGASLSSILKTGATPDTPPAVHLGIELLQRLLKRMPGVVPAYIELARCFCAQNKFDDACKCLRQCLGLQPHCSAALVALARTECARFNVVPANHALEQALSSDFSIRGSPLFKLVQATVRAQQGKADEAMAEIEAIMKEDDFKTAVGDGLETFSRLSSHSGSLRLTTDDRVAVFIAQASLLNLARRVKDANKVLSEAKILFSGTPQEVQILVASSQLAVERGDYDAAIRVLDKIQDDSPTFFKAQLIKAEIMLTNNRDKEGFTKCYEQLVEKQQSSSAYCMLGEAYLRILSPEAAVEAFEQAYRLDTSNAQLRERIGRSLVATHEYHRAVDFYESALREVSKTVGSNQTKSSEAVALGHDLAKLYMKLGRTESAIRVLNVSLHDSQRDIFEMRNDIVTWKLLFAVQKDTMIAEALDALKRAKDLQKLVMNEVRLSLNNASTSSSEIMEHEKVILSGLCVELGDLLSSSGDYKGAETQYTEAIQHSSQNVNAMLGLARLFKAKRNVEQCIAHCRKIILFDAAHEGACILLSETLSQERQSEADDEAAALPLKELLAGHPNNYHALSSLITILRKMGYLVLANSYIEAAEKADRRAASHAGFRYCRGLYARAINDVGKAIHEFNFARKDIVWGENALVNMVELYLNPDQEGAWEERDESKSDETSASHIRIAEDLLKELKPICKDQAKLAILSNYCTFAHKDKASISTGISRFSDMVEENSENVSALLGLATGHMLEKNQPKALSVLKKISGLKQKIGFNEDFEKANLLLARLQIEKASTDTVEELCNACLSQNKSCAQAFELLGLMKEKNGDYEGASEHYYHAWKLEFEASAPTGFKLAFCLLKCRRCVEAVNICEKVLDQYPDYPRITEEILRKAHQEMRTRGD